MQSDAINRKIEKAKRELEHLIDLNPSVMLLTDSNSFIIRANKALLGLLNLEDFSTVLDKKLSDVFSPANEAFFKEMIEYRSGYCSRQNIVNINSQDRLLKFTMVGSGQQTGLFALIVSDITVENEQASHLEKQHKLEAVKALMGALLHNINQPLTVIMMRAQLMHLALEKGSIQPDEMVRSLRDIMSLTTDIAGMLRQLEQPAEFITEPYSKGVDILDIQLSTGKLDLDMSNMGIPHALILALDAHERGSAEHARTTSCCAAMLAEYLGLSYTDCENVKRCAFLHDLGKIGIPSTILQKPGPLSDEEKTTMRTHPIIGYELLNHFPFMKNEAETAKTHAEWFDGSGYPDGLAGNKIPMTSKITAVADAYSALRQKRAYKEVFSPDETLKIISDQSGTKFDPDIVSTLIKHQDDIEKALCSID